MNKNTSSILEDIVTADQKPPSELDKITDKLLNDLFKRRKTILENRQIAQITNIDVISQIYNIRFLREWINNYAEWRTSGDHGKGRQDIVDIAKARVEELKQKNVELMEILRNK